MRILAERMAACHRCGTAFEAANNVSVSRQATCRSCHGWLRTCHNCRFHDPRAKNECTEPQAEPVRDKDTANFCELFAANTRTGNAASPPAPAEDPFDALFKK